MSRTDKDRPAWVQKFDPTVRSIVRHDHTKGECREETLSDARLDAAGGHRRHHRCAKVQVIVEYCTRKAPRQRPGTVFKCWDFVGGPYDPVLGLQPRPCEGHRVVTRDESIDCSCDRWPEREPVTCDRWFNLGYCDAVSKFYGEHPPREFVHAVWWGPDRARVRDELVDARKRYNAGDDDVDVENRQHRHSAGWLWW